MTFSFKCYVDHSYATYISGNIDVYNWVHLFESPCISMFCFYIYIASTTVWHSFCTVIKTRGSKFVRWGCPFARHEGTWEWRYCSTAVFLSVLEGGWKINFVPRPPFAWCRDSDANEIEAGGSKSLSAHFGEEIKFFLLLSTYTCV